MKITDLLLDRRNAHRTRLDWFFSVDEAKAHFFPASINYHSRTLVMSSAVDYWKSLPMLSLGDKNMLFHPNLCFTQVYVLQKRQKYAENSRHDIWRCICVCVCVHFMCFHVLFKAVQSERILFFSSTSIDSLIILFPLMNISFLVEIHL